MRCTLPVLAFTLIWPCSAAQAQLYPMTSMDGGGTLSSGRVEAVNGAGQRVGAGAAQPGGNDRPVIWNGLLPAFLPLLPGDEFGVAVDINDAGIAVGTSHDVVTTGGSSIVTPHPVRWSGGVATDLRPVVTGGAALLLDEATGIDGTGRVIGLGHASGGAPSSRGWLLTGGTLQDLGSLGPAGAGCQPNHIDAAGRVVGTSATTLGPFTPTHAFVWQNGVMTDLHDPSQLTGTYSEALDSNGAGQICGTASFPGLSSTSAALWQPDGTILNLDPGDLPGIPKVVNSIAMDINEAGDVVGIVYENAFVWRDGVMEDLNSLIVPAQPPEFILGIATSIDDAGRITAFGFGAPMPVLLVPACGGKFRIDGTGCAGSGGFSPRLAGQGCAIGGNAIQLAVTHGLGGAPGLLLIGTGSASAPFKGCALHNLPLLPLSLPLALAGAGPGEGFWNVVTTLPAAAPPITLRLQAAFADTGSAAHATVSNALTLEIH